MTSIDMAPQEPSVVVPLLGCLVCCFRMLTRKELQWRLQAGVSGCRTLKMIRSLVQFCRLCTQAPYRTPSEKNPYLSGSLVLPLCNP